MDKNFQRIKSEGDKTMSILQSAAFWAVVLVAVIFIGGLFTGFFYQKPEIKPTLSAQLNETEEDIKEELEDD